MPVDGVCLLHHINLHPIHNPSIFKTLLLYHRYTSKPRHCEVEGNAAKDRPNGTSANTDMSVTVNLVPSISKLIQSRPTPKPVDNDQGLPVVDPDPCYMTTEEVANHLNKLDAAALSKATPGTGAREREMNASISASLKDLVVEAAVDRDTAKSVSGSIALHRRP